MLDGEKLSYRLCFKHVIQTTLLRLLVIDRTVPCELTLRHHAFYEPGHIYSHCMLRRRVMQNHVIGIDVSVCAIYDGKIRKKSFANAESGFNKLAAWMSALGIEDPHICLEATGCYSEPAADFLFSAGHKVSVVNPLPIKAFRMSKMIRQKTDRSDSEVIAKFCLQNDPRYWEPKSQTSKELHEINFRIDSLKMEFNRLNNQLEKSYLNQPARQIFEKFFI